MSSGSDDDNDSEYSDLVRGNTVFRQLLPMLARENARLLLALRQLSKWADKYHETAATIILTSALERNEALSGTIEDWLAEDPPEESTSSE